MIVVFAGPSLPDAQARAGDAIDIRPPALQGDILGAVEDGATAIGLIDGGFEYAPSVWHKEILYALSENIAVYGAASMGALRAAECQAFGMIGIGDIYQRYSCGDTVDDSDVALLHAPAELGYAALTVPMVNVDATLHRMEALEVLSASRCWEIKTQARQMFYKHRSWSSIADRAAQTAELPKKTLLDLFRSHAIDQKRLDAESLLDVITSLSAKPLNQENNWKFIETSIWRKMRNLRIV